MAKNLVYKTGEQLLFTGQTGKVSGDPFVVGQIPAVAMADADSNGNVVGRTVGVFELAVTAVSTNITPGTAIYYHAGTLNNTAAGGVLFGYALDNLAVGSGTIKVLLARS